MKVSAIGFVLLMITNVSLALASDVPIMFRSPAVLVPSAPVSREPAPKPAEAKEDTLLVRELLRSDLAMSGIYLGAQRFGISPYQVPGAQFSYGVDYGYGLNPYFGATGAYSGAFGMPGVMPGMWYPYDVMGGCCLMTFP